MLKTDCLLCANITMSLAVVFLGAAIVTTFYVQELIVALGVIGIVLIPSVFLSVKVFGWFLGTIALMRALASYLGMLFINKDEE